MARLHGVGHRSSPKALAEGSVRADLGVGGNVCSDPAWDLIQSRLRQGLLPLKSAISCRLLALLFLTIFLGSPAFAQTDVNDVHVQPRDLDKPADKPADVASAKADTVDANSKLSAHVRPLKVDVDLVLVPVTVTDPMNRLVTGLEKENFELYEGNQPQQIRSFSSEDAPVSLGVIFDSSGSMTSKMDRAKDAVMEFFKTANPQDEFFMITFSDEPEAVTDFTSSVDEIQNKLVFAVPRRRTALLDAIYMGISKMRQAKYPKKALLIISDGGDNHSRYTENEIKSVVKEADVMIYAIGIYDRFFATTEERLGPELLSEITELTGGRAFTIDNPNDLGDVATKIGVELRNQYVLGYRPTKLTRDGKWRKIKVKLLPPKGLPPLRVYARTGYYAPAE
ncbi:MAG TPA: VWA domain-containing protein [Verrucomicrobiae bacterium]|jgi:Ca-activated chloride channel homolog|nr:VWA domain-containing protein [Verrucomicrobiae bacterium]